MSSPSSAREDLAARETAGKASAVVTAVATVDPAVTVTAGKAVESVAMTTAVPHATTVPAAAPDLATMHPHLRQRTIASLQRKSSR